MSHEQWMQSRRRFHPSPTIVWALRRAVGLPETATANEVLAAAERIVLAAKERGVCDAEGSVKAEGHGAT